MIELGWKQYGDDTNIPDVPYVGVEGLCKTKWVHYDMRSPNPVIEGTNGPDEPIYTQDLHAVPQLHPNFDEAKGFQDDRLQIFHPAFRSWALVDRALGELGDVGLDGEVNRFRYWANERDRKRQQHIELEAEILHTEQEYLTSAHYLVRARGASRVGTQTFHHAIQMPAPISRPLPPSSILHRTPLFTTSPRPDERASSPSDDDQGKVALTRPNKGKRKRSYYCLVCEVPKDHTYKKCEEHCSWCGEDDHPSDLCEAPHVQCSSNDCVVPLTHEFYGLICPELANQVAVDHLCEFCDQVGDTCVEASP
jgi:hypothetical protein